MAGKHMKMKGKKKRKLKITDKGKFIRGMVIIILVILSIVCIAIHGNTKQEIKPIGVVRPEILHMNETSQELINDNLLVAERESTYFRPEMKVTSRGGISRENKEQKTETTILETPITMYVIAKEGLNVRENYNINAKILKVLPYSTQVIFTEKYQNWVKIGENQWVSCEYLSETKPVVEKKTATKTKVKTPSSTPSNGYIAFTATGYCPCKKCCGKTNGVTASGAKAKAGITVAMSSKYKFGTKVEIKGMGTYTVQDRGGAIQGNKIDIYFNTHQEALNFGRRTVYLKVI